MVMTSGGAKSFTTRKYVPEYKRTNSDPKTLANEAEEEFRSRSRTVGSKPSRSKPIFEKVTMAMNTKFRSRSRTVPLFESQKTDAGKLDDITVAAATTTITTTSSGHSSTKASRQNLHIRDHVGVLNFDKNAVEFYSTFNKCTDFSPMFFNHRSPTVPKFNFVVFGENRLCRSIDLIDSLTMPFYKRLFQIDFAETTEQNTVHLLVAGNEFELSFFEIDTEKNDLWQSASGAGYLILYDVNNETSFRNACSILREIRNLSRTSLLNLIILIGCSSSTTLIKTCVSHEKVKYVAKHNRCRFIDMSAADGRNTEKLLSVVLNYIDKLLHLSTDKNHRRASSATAAAGCLNLSKTRNFFSSKTSKFMTSHSHQSKISNISKSLEELFV